jgi:hypothetical protein
MFGYVNADLKALSPAQKQRYSAVYCGICRCIRAQASQTARLTLSYDMAFLALLLMSLYEPEEQVHPNACILHPIKKRPWVDSPYVRYAADMNVALAYYNCLDDWQDDGKHAAKLLANKLAGSYASIALRYRRQCDAIERCIAELSRLEKENCANADEVAGCFGQLMGELLVFEEDFWAPTLREMGMALGRFIYLADAAVDYCKDSKKKKYNPYLAMGTGENWPQWEEYLVLAMSRCTQYYEKLPLVQDKAILDNILYSGVWTHFGKLRQKAGEQS